MHHLTLMLDTSESNPMMNSEINRPEENLPLIIRWWVIDFYSKNNQNKEIWRRKVKRNFVTRQERKKIIKKKKKKESHVTWKLSLWRSCRCPVKEEPHWVPHPTPPHSKWLLHQKLLKVNSASLSSTNMFCFKNIFCFNLISHCDRNLSTTFLH